jgi:hypothetical protein
MHLMNLKFSIAACLILGWQTAFSLEVIEVTVDVEDGLYRVFGQSRIEATPEFVYATLIDYDNFHKLADGIAESKILPSDESGNMLAYTRFESCVLVFCKTIEKVERIDGNPPASIDVEAIPKRSDFSFNESRWRIEHSGETTLLTFEAEFDPDFWIPPVIGTWAIRSKLVHTAELIGMRIEWMQTHGLTLAQVTE